MNSVLEYAKLYASLGWKVFPVNKRKRPAVKWTTECTTDIKKIEDWYRKNPHLGVGIACGPSNLFVLDIDIKKDEDGNIKHNGFIELERLLDQHGSLPDTLISQTGGGGRHYFFRSSEGGAKDSAGKIAPAIDVRCNSGYVVAPPSLHETGNEYCWQDDEPNEIELASVPDWLLEKARGNCEVAKNIPPAGVRRQQGWNGTTDVSAGARHDSMISFIGKLIQQGGTIKSIYRKANLANTNHCIPPIDESEMKTMLNSAINSWIPEEARNIGVIQPIEYYLTEKYRAKTFSEKFISEVKYIHDQNVWGAWGGECWNIQSSTKDTLVKFRLNKLNEELWESIAGMANPLRQQMIQFAKKCETNKNMDAVIAIARMFMKKSFNDFNTEDYLFSCANGLIDLKTGKLMDHDSKYLLTQTSNIEFNPEGTCNNFLSFLDDITNSDEKLKDYLQKLVGYCLTASISERAVFIFYGHGRNGKSTFLRILHELLGDYTKAVSTQTFTDKRSDSVRNDLASLHDARLVATSELGHNGVLDATLIKELTGGDPITCRFLYRENFSFIPKFKLIMAVNQRPYPSVRDQAIWDRIHEVPFKVRISDDKLVAQEQLLALFHLEMSGILNWALEGCLKWQKEGLGMPESVVEATQDYKTAVDPTSLWVETRFTGKEEDTVPTGLLFDDYMKFARENEINLSDNFDSRRFGNTTMKKFKSKARRIDGSIAKHYIGFKLPN